MVKLKNLKVIKGDIRNQSLLNNILKDQDTVIHLACISNDPSFELNPILGKSINLDAFEPLVKISKHLGISRFIYASSSSVYGVKQEKDIKQVGLYKETLIEMGYAVLETILVYVNLSNLSIELVHNK